jgi:lipopolysaccharide/colanic/teichoic acid biosynthesis glycosyltransferase
MYPLFKRIFDITASGLALLILSPALAVIAFRIKKFDGGPILYAGRRAGVGGVPFGMYKFRTMVMNADKIGGSSTPDDDPRITPIGKFLRRHKLDEFPQLINVFKGEMSIVGPRPQVLDVVAGYNETERLVLTVPPGMTDFASIRFHNEGEILKGSLDPDKDYMEKIHPEKMRLGVEYVRTRSMMTDLRIIGQTAATVLKH